jgi:gliding motility-associated-like protein
VNVTVLLLPVLNASKSNDINCYLPYAKLKANDASQYFWSPASTLSKNSISNPIANPSVTTTYFVTGTNNSGCSAIDSITVIADFSIGVISVPNSFTPNRDGINDCFGIKYHRDVKNLIFIIYNRFGTKVFETTNADECWNGYFKGQPADPGSYVYYLSANTLCGYIVKKGSILLIR